MKKEKKKMGWKDLQKLTRLENPSITKSSNNNNNNNNNNNEFDRLKGLPFWIWDQQEHKRIDNITRGQCCFNHVIGLPKDNNVLTKENPLFDYQQLIFEELQDHKHIWIKKATGLGVTEFFLRYMAWLCLKDDTYQQSQMVIVTGPNIDLAIKLIRRMKNLFLNKLYIIFDSKEIVIELNRCRIEAYPSNHIESFRSLDNCKFILLDEADFFRKNEQNEVRHVAERYIAKSNPYIVMVSTPNKPGGLFEQIEQEPEETCLYKRIKLDYRVGLGKIYSIEDIEKAKISPSFDREYDLKYLGTIGNVFSLTDIDKAIELGSQFENLEMNPYCLHVGGVDFGFSSSFTALYIAELDSESQIVRIIYGKEFGKSAPSYIADIMFDLHTQIPNLIYFVDGANRGAVNECRSKFGESLDWIKPEDINIQDNHVIPVAFNREHKTMLEHLYQLLSKHKLAIPSKYDKLILSLKTAYAEDFDLDKEETVNSDSLDALRLLCKGVIFKGVDD